MATAWAAAAALALCLFIPARAQNNLDYQYTEFLDDLTDFPAPEDSYSLGFDGTLEPSESAIFNITVPSNFTRPDLLLTLTVDADGAANFELLCDPTFGDPDSAPLPGPQPHVWYGDLVTPRNDILISRNHPYNKQFYPDAAGGISFQCEVLNADAALSTDFTLDVSIFENNATLLPAEQEAAASLFASCCQADGACAAWKAAGGAETDMCSVEGQVCNPAGHLWRLDLDDSGLACAWPGSLLAQFPQLNTLSLGGNPDLTGSIEDAFATAAALGSVQSFNLSGSTSLAGDLSSACPAIQEGRFIEINLLGMDLNSTIPACLFDSDSLCYLDLGQNLLGGSIPDAFAEESPLQLLHVAQNELTGQLPASLAIASLFTSFDASSNALTGTIPAAFGEMPNLYSFVVNSNQLAGAIPDSFATTPNLVYLEARANALTSLPASWSDAAFDASNSRLNGIRVSLNELEGPFPAGLMRAPELLSITLNENKLTGPLPGENAMFPALQSFNLSANRLTGSIPAAWAQVPIFAKVRKGGRQIFDVSNNRLSGALPSFMAASAVANRSMELLLQGNQLTADCSSPEFGYISSLCPAAAPTLAPAARTGRL